AQGPHRSYVGRAPGSARVLRKTRPGGALPMPIDGSSPAAPAIEAHDLTKTYRGGVEALRGVSFAAAPGSVFALLGPNGAGKSTTVKILTTLTRADRGEARVAGLDVAREPARVRGAIGVVAQRSAVD